MTDPFTALAAADPELAEIVRREVERQNTTIQLIASENFTSLAVLAAQGSVLTNKYSEGYPGKRYYGGNYVDDDAVGVARDRVGALFLVDAAHIAGLIVGGAHPSPAPYADIITLTTHKTLRGPRAGCILCREEYAAAIDKAVFPGLQGGPLMHVIAAKAVAFHEAAQPGFRAYAAGIVRNSQALAGGLHGEGVRVVSGGAAQHPLLVDLPPLRAT